MSTWATPSAGAAAPMTPGVALADAVDGASPRADERPAGEPPTTMRTMGADSRSTLDLPKVTSAGGSRLTLLQGCRLGDGRCAAASGCGAADRTALARATVPPAALATLTAGSADGTLAAGAALRVNCANCWTCTGQARGTGSGGGPAGIAPVTDRAAATSGAGMGVCARAGKAQATAVKSHQREPGVADWAVFSRTFMRGKFSGLGPQKQCKARLLPWITSTQAAGTTGASA